MPPERVTTDETSARAVLAGQRRFVVALTTTLVGVVIISLASRLTNALVWRPEFDLHKAQEQQEREELKNMLRDVLCSQQPAHWRCKT
jgi:hypothetical protein